MTLEDLGLPPDARPGKHRARCPKCSDTRSKRGRKCLTVAVFEDGFRWFCWHRCGFEGEHVEDERPDWLRFRGKEAA